MKKIIKLRICAWSLAIFTAVMLSSGLQLEISPFGGRIWVWSHIAAGCIFIGTIIWHISLHKSTGVKWYGYGNIYNKHRWLSLFFAFTLISGLLATIHWIGIYSHSTIGGIHGKLGFIFIIIVIRHIDKHIKFYQLK